ncbi:MAG: acyl-CoA dehydrogenase family protein [Chloroflexi bacterium]|nr:acyl-CoA dehydrogenase family protein [Chloroflexota bacterium]
MRQYSLTEDQLALQETVRRLARERVAARAGEIDETAEYPQDMFDLLKRAELFGLIFSEELGGSGGGVLAGCIAVEELGRVCYNTAYLLVVQWGPTGAIMSAGTESQKRRYLGGLARGDLRGAISVTEPSGGSDVAGLTTRAVRDGDDYVIDGQKIFCTNGAVADFVVVAARTGPSAGARGISAFIVDRDTPGFRIGRAEHKLGGRGVPSNQLFFDGARVPASQMLGQGNDGFKAVMSAFNRTRPIIGSRGVGLAQGAMDLAVDYAKGRVAFGQPIAQYQGLRWMIADMAIQIEAARQLVYRSAAAIDAGEPAKTIAPLAAMAKCFASDVAMKVAVDAVQVFGAYGVSKDYPIERFMRDAKLLQIVEGTNQIQRNIVANAVLS